MSSSSSSSCPSDSTTCPSDSTTCSSEGIRNRTSKSHASILNTIRNAANNIEVKGNTVSSDIIRMNPVSSAETSSIKTLATSEYVRMNGHEIYQHRWIPDCPKEEIKACLYISHGNCEHGGRYEEMGRTLNKAKIAVFAHDHLAHGMTAEKEGCVPGDTNLPWEQIPSDFKSATEVKMEEYPGIPFYVYGHSVGSVACQKALTLSDGALAKKVSGVILSGPVFRPGGGVAILFALVIQIFGFFMGKHEISRFQNFIERTLVFNEYQADFKPNKTDFDWICRNQKANQGYIDDKHCGHNLSWWYWGGFYKALTSVNTDSYECLRMKPVMVMLGSEDPLAREPINPFSPKWKVLLQLLQEMAPAELKICIYGSYRHEPHQDENKQSIYEDIRHFLLNEKKVTYQSKM